MAGFFDEPRTLHAEYSISQQKQFKSGLNTKLRKTTANLKGSTKYLFVHSSAFVQQNQRSPPSPQSERQEPKGQEPSPEQKCQEFPPEKKYQKLLSKQKYQKQKPTESKHHSSVIASQKLYFTRYLSLLMQQKYYSCQKEKTGEKD